MNTLNGNSVGFDVTAKWAKVVQKLTPTEQVQALSSKQIPDTFWDAQKEFIKALHAAFKKLPKDNPFGLDAAALKILNSLFSTAERDKLMVRSTGKEDTRKMANAGGNESIPNVSPTMTDVLKAAEKVVVSYFGEKSLNQRLGLGDQTLFSEEVFCPLLMQRMIGEQKGTGFPSCGVMFTEEMEGGISYLHKEEDKGTVKTTGITLIQAAYGHNEGVVNSKVVTDTFVAQNINGKPVFYPTIRAKRERLVPATDGLEMQKNPKLAVTAPALNQKTLVTLKKFADALEHYYRYPVDVEFVLRDGAIWIVQARPLVQKEERKTRQPAYFANLKNFPEGTVSKGRTIGAFGGAIVEVESKEQCIISDRIGTALDTYLKSKRDTIKCVFSGTDAPATSHEATTFRSEGKPVIYVFDLEGLRNAFITEKKLVFSPQQHCVAVVSADVQPETKDGWCAYPLPRELSVVQALFIGEDKDDFDGPIRVTEKFDIHELLEQLKGEDAQAALNSAQQLPNVIYESLFRKIKLVKRDADLDKQIKLIVRASQVLCKRIEKLCSNQAPLLERLLPINYLEALIYQNTFGDKALKYLSVAMLGKTLKQEKIDTTSTVVFGSEETKAIHTQLKKVTSVAFEEKTQGAWNTLINTLSQDKDSHHIRSLGKLVETLSTFDILPLWMHSSLVNDVEKLGESPTKEACALLVGTWVKSIKASRESFDLIKQLQERVTGFDIGRFSDPKKFDDAWRDFEALLNQFMALEFIGIIRKVTESEAKLAGAAACGLMGKFVDLFDTSIKSLTGIKKGTLEPQIQAKRFQIMLKEYYALLDNWVKLVPAGAIQYHKHANDKYSFTLAKLLELMKHVVNKKTLDNYDLELTSNFSAMAATIGSAATSPLKM